MSHAKEIWVYRPFTQRYESIETVHVSELLRTTTKECGHLMLEDGDYQRSYPERILFDRYKEMESEDEQDFCLEIVGSLSGGMDIPVFSLKVWCGMGFTCKTIDGTNLAHELLNGDEVLDFLTTTTWINKNVGSVIYSYWTCLTK